jgi:hypothetical protein
MAIVLPNEVRQQKIDSIKGVISDRNYYELYGHYYNAESNGQWEYFKYFTTEVDKIRAESLSSNFTKLINLL